MNDTRAGAGDVNRFRCPICGTPSGDIRQGRELHIEGLEIDARDDEAEAMALTEDEKAT